MTPHDDIPGVPFDLVVLTARGLGVAPVSLASAICLAGGRVAVPHTPFGLFTASRSVRKTTLLTQSVIDYNRRMFAQYAPPPLFAFTNRVRCTVSDEPFRSVPGLDPACRKITADAPKPGDLGFLDFRIPPEACASASPVPDDAATYVMTNGSAIRVDATGADPVRGVDDFAEEAARGGHARFPDPAYDRPYGPAADTPVYVTRPSADTRDRDRE